MTAVAVLIGVAIGGIAVLAIGCCVLAGQADREEDAYLESLQARLSDVSGGDAVSTPSSRATSPAGRESTEVPPPLLASTPQRSEPRRRPDSVRPRPAPQ